MSKPLDLKCRSGKNKRTREEEREKEIPGFLLNLVANEIKAGRLS